MHSISNMKHIKWTLGAATLVAASLYGVPAQAQLVGQWDFENDNDGYAATVGQAIEPLGDLSNTEFGDTDFFGVDPIDGEVANVMFYDFAGEPGLGYKVFTGTANGGGANVNQYTLIMDIFWDVGGVWRSIFQTDVTGTSDGDFFVNPSDGIGISGQYEGVIRRNNWHRIAAVVDQAGGSIRKFIDGRLVGVNQFGGAVDGRFSVNAEGSADPFFLLFADESGETEPGYVNSIAYYQNLIPDGVIELLGAPTAAGIPTELPVAQPAVSTFIPADGSSASLPSSTVEAVIALAGVPVDIESITMTLDDEVVTPEIIASETEIRVVFQPVAEFEFSSEHMASVSFSSTGADAQSFTEEWAWTTVELQNTLTPDMMFDGNVGARGFLVRTIQLENGILNNSDARAEETLAGLYDESIAESTDGPAFWTTESGVINYDQSAGAQGEIRGTETTVPGLASGDQNDFVFEALTILDLPAGFHLMAVNSDDGFKVTSGIEPRSPNAKTMGIFNGGRGASTSLFNFFVEEAGLYAFRLTWYEDGGGANCEWWMQTADGERILINDDSNSDAVVAYVFPTQSGLPGLIEPGVAGFTPGNGATGIPAYQDFSVSLVNSGEPIDEASLTLSINGEAKEVSVSSETISEGAQEGNEIITVSWDNQGTLEAGALVDATISMTFAGGAKSASFDWSARVSDYPSVAVDAAQPAGAVAGDTGMLMNLSIINTDAGSGIPGNVSGAWFQLSGASEFDNEVAFGPHLLDFPMDVEMSSNSGNNFFGEDNIPDPWIDAQGFVSVAAQFYGYLELDAGYHRFGINRAGGVNVVFGGNPLDFFAPSLVSAGTSNDITEVTFDLFVEEAGFYGIRIDYWQSDAGSQNSQLEFYSFNDAGERTLINGDEAGAIAAYPSSTAEVAPFIAFATPLTNEFPQEELRIVVDPGTFDGEPTFDLMLNEAVVAPNSETVNGRTALTVAPGGTRLKEEKHIAKLTIGTGDVESVCEWVLQGIDNTEGGTNVGGTAFFSEDFEGVTLMPNVDEGTPGEFQEAWSREGPEGWVIDTSGVPGVDSPDEDGDGLPDNDGVTEWAGWTFASKDFWFSADGQRRAEFTLSEGTVLVADPDEWDDKGHADSAANGWYETWVDLPTISLEGTDENAAILKFDSSWRPEFDSNYRQSGEITVSFDGGDPQQVLLWLSDSSSPFFKDDNSTNETIVIPLFNPAGASEIDVRIRMFDAGNDWWWAIDNVELLRANTPLISTDLPVGKIEEAAGPLPGDPLPLERFAFDPSTRVLTMEIGAGVAASVEKTADVVNGPWESVASGSTGEFVITVSDDDSQAYFRVVAE